jgi:DNA-binding transcriptional ArsR family regulator
MLMTLAVPQQSKEVLFEESAALFKALAHPIRLKLVCGLCHEAGTQSQISRSLDIPQSTLAQHLAVLRREGIVEGHRKSGAEVLLSVTDERVLKIFRQVCPSFDEMDFSWK